MGAKTRDSEIIGLGATDLGFEVSGHPHHASSRWCWHDSYLGATDLDAELGAIDLGVEIKTKWKDMSVTAAVQRQRTKRAWCVEDDRGNRRGLSSRWLTVAPSPCGWLWLGKLLWVCLVPGLSLSQASIIQLGLVWLRIWLDSQASISLLCTNWVACWKRPI